MTRETVAEQLEAMPVESVQKSGASLLEKLRLYFHQAVDHTSSLGFFTAFVGGVTHLLKPIIDALVLLGSGIASLVNIIMMNLFELYHIVRGKIQRNIKIRTGGSLTTIGLAVPALLITIGVIAVAPIAVPLMLIAIGCVGFIKETLIINEAEKEIAAKYSNVKELRQARVTLQAAKQKRMATGLLFLGAGLLAISIFCPPLAILGAVFLFFAGVALMEIDKNEHRQLEESDKACLKLEHEDKSNQEQKNISQTAPPKKSRNIFPKTDVTKEVARLNEKFANTIQPSQIEKEKFSKENRALTEKMTRRIKEIDSSLGLHHHGIFPESPYVGSGRTREPLIHKL